MPLRVRTPSDDEPPLRPCRTLALRLVRVSNHCIWEQGQYTMMRAFTPSACRSTLALLAVLAGASCDHSDTLESPTEGPTAAALGDSTAPGDSAALPDTVALTDSLNPAFATVSYSGLPYGPIGLWNGPTGFEGEAKAGSVGETST
jgi:hypothetical protein